ncbi:restriction endonuclease subunit S [Nostoc sp. LEGE 12447]|uniref:restriction endonuclease subunit S n=1 Tax=Nostoc sp. LEGE 12447 TaxID=1828640 RepID=UPI00188462F5|nr:restriction endonuclease subunit S [Nostoc sp. LEGE 12447]MBE9002611.1 restriction endonuclease subunit S [Nostoc sp. LEGE 12447]
MTFPKYESYKDSGVEWIGEIPSHWKLRKAKYLWRELEERSVSGDEQLLSVSQYSGIIPRDEDSRSESLIDYKRCEPNDLVVNIMLAWMGSLGISEYIGIVSPAYCVYRQLQNHNSKYLGYLYKTSIYLAEFARRSKGVVPSRWRIYTEDFGQVLTLLPPREEQQRIVTFLERTTAEIDEAIAKKQRLIKLLQEQKTILINQAVTKGLNPKAPMRDSGVEWIGEIPATWRISRIKYLFENFNGIQMGPFGSMLIDISEQPTPYKLYGQQNTISGDFSNVSRWLSPQKFKSLKKYVVKPGDIVTTRKGSIGNCRLIGSDVDEGVIDSDTIRIRVNKSIIVPDFLALLLHEAYYVNSMIFFNRRGAVLSGLNTSTIADLIIAFPNIDEQMEILNYVRKLQEQFNYTFEVINNHLTTLNEYKSQIIAQTVTGKIKV